MVTWQALLNWERFGATAPWVWMFVFLAASALMIWRLEALGRKGFEGTVLGTVIMPYCSGVGNLVFGRKNGRQTALEQRAVAQTRHQWAEARLPQ